MLPFISDSPFLGIPISSHDLQQDIDESAKMDMGFRHYSPSILGIPLLATRFINGTIRQAWFSVIFHA